MNTSRPPITFAALMSVVMLQAVSASAGQLDVCALGCPYIRIQDAIDAAIGGDHVVVQPGTYFERINFSGKAITVRSTGGAAQTIIDGQSLGRVVTFDTAEGRNSVLDGFTVQNGLNTDVSLDRGYGGGIFIHSASPTIRNCTITGNVSQTAGGRIGMGVNSDPAIMDCTISGNTASGTTGLHNGGGGIYASFSNPVITSCDIADNAGGLAGGGVKFREVSETGTMTGCTVHGNTAIMGGGIYLHWSQAAVVGSDIYANISSGDGGGVYNDPTPSLYLPRFSRCGIHGNATVSGNGGGIFAAWRLKLEECVIAGNGAGGGGNGGGIYGAVREMSSCTVSGNRASGNGGGIYYRLTWDPVTPNEVLYINNTVAGNSAAGMGGGLFLTYGFPVMVNSIFWGNAPEQVRLYEMATLDLSYSDVQGGNPADPALPWEGTGNIKDDPLFVDPRPASEAPTAAGDYHLADSSAALDRGTSVGAPALDIDHEESPWGLAFDMGSDEARPLVVNGNFETGSGVPAPWAGHALQAGDKRITGPARNGGASFRVSGSTANKTLRQTIVPEVRLGGQPFLLSGWSKARGVLPSGGAYGLEARIYYDDLTTARFRVGFTKGRHAWQYREKSFTAAKAFSRIVVTLRFANQAGRVWFDDVVLKRQ